MTDQDPTDQGAAASGRSRAGLAPLGPQHMRERIRDGVEQRRAADHLAWSWGPSWLCVLDIVDAARRGTAEDLAAVTKHWDQLPVRDMSAAIRAAVIAAAAPFGHDPDNPNVAEVPGAVTAAEQASRRAAIRCPSVDRVVACEAWRAAGRAAALHHLIGQHGWTTQYEDLLAGPVCQQFGLRWTVTRPLRAGAHAPDRAALAQPPRPSQDRGMMRT